MLEHGRCSEISECVSRLAVVVKERSKLRFKIEDFIREEKELVARLGLLYGPHSVQEAVEKVKHELGRIKKSADKRRSVGACSYWANLPEDMRKKRIEKLAQARQKRLDNLRKLEVIAPMV